MLGAIGLAIGAAVAGAFRTSDLENEWIGDLSDEVKADLNTRAGAVSQSLREASDTLQAEFSERGPRISRRHGCGRRSAKKEIKIRITCERSMPLSTTRPQKSI